jgi:hypothetical protein
MAWWYFTKHRYVITVPDGYASVILAKFDSQSILNVFFLLTKLLSLKKKLSFEACDRFLQTRMKAMLSQYATDL